MTINKRKVLQERFFQYSQQMKKQLAERFDIDAIKFVALNVPPAFDYVCRKRGVS